MRSATCSGPLEVERWLDSITLMLMTTGCVAFISVDVRIEKRSADDPLMVQVLLGNHQRSGLIWHLDGQSVAAVDPRLPCWSTSMTIVDSFGSENLDPALSRITARDARDALRHFLETGERSTALDWETVPGD